MFIAELESGHFRFQALGETEEGAVAALRTGWNKHRAQYRKAYGADHGVMTFAEIAEYCGVNVAEISLGKCLRDGSVIS